MSKGFTSPLPPSVARQAPLLSLELIQRLRECFAAIEDPRVERTRLHSLCDILTIAILSVLAGGKGWEDMEVYKLSKHQWLTTFLALPNGIPSADTFRRVFECIKPKQLEHCFEQWVQQLVQELGIQVIAIDGKSPRGSYDRDVLVPKRCIWSVLGHQSIAWFWRRAKCRISSMKLPRFQPYWKYSTFKAVLSPWMR
jgi:DDE_Tnp_1-associated